MDKDARLGLLRKIYQLFDNVLDDFRLHCRKQCAQCCTRNVTMTTLESVLMVEHLETMGNSEWQEMIAAAGGQPRLLPQTTPNQFADLCAADAPVPEDVQQEGQKACPFLRDDLCTVYAVRPFGCRAMVSRSHCALHGEADMPEFVLTVNNLFMQYIEALDVDRFFGNMIDVLMVMGNTYQRRAYETHMPMHPTSALLVNRPVSVLMVPPEHRQQIDPLMQALIEAQQQIAGRG